MFIHNYSGFQAIFLRRGSDGNGPKGLYSLQMNSSLNDGNSTSYTVAFEDRGDATNFCYLLESFFEELGDVSADIVPLTIQVRVILDSHIIKFQVWLYILFLLE